MDYRREFVCYTHPSQFQDSQHRKQVKSYVSARAYWVEPRIRHNVVHARIIQARADGAEEAFSNLDRSGHSLKTVSYATRQAGRTKGSKGERDVQVGRLCAFHYESLRQKHRGSQVLHLTEPVPKASAHSKDAHADQSGPQRHCVYCPAIQIPSTPSLVPAIGALPTVLRQSQGFHGASEFYLEVVDPHYPPVCHIFDVVNCFGQNYHKQMQQDEDALHAGVAAVQVMKGMFMSPCTANRLPEDILALVHVAISKLRVRIAKDECSNDEVTIMVVLFLAHLAMVFKDMAAFQAHRKAIKLMVSTRGGFDKLDQESLVAPTVRQFELWWSQLHGDGIFYQEECTIAHHIFYPQPPFSVEIREIVDKIPLGFQDLTQVGRFSKQMIILLGRISYYEKLNKTNPIRAREVLYARTSARNSRSYNNFNEACPALSKPGADLEKYLSSALLIYCGLTFSPRRDLLEACNLIFLIPRIVLTRELPFLVVASAEESQCLKWTWLVLIASLIIANTKRSTAGKELTLQLVDRFPTCRRWDRVEGILKEFFASEMVLEALSRHWQSMSWQE